MDPNATLAQIREGLRLVLDESEESQYVDTGDCLDLANAVRALDEWLSRGGFRPDAWATPATPKRHPAPEQHEHSLLWVCTDCILQLVNADTAGCPEEKVPTLWSKVDPLPPGSLLTPGMLTSEHEDSCPVFYGGITGAEFQCDCDRIEFSTRPCDGCGEDLGGSRFAATLWTRKQVA